MNQHDGGGCMPPLPFVQGDSMSVMFEDIIARRKQRGETPLTIPHSDDDDDDEDYDDDENDNDDNDDDNDSDNDSGDDYVHDYDHTTTTSTLISVGNVVTDDGEFMSMDGGGGGEEDTCERELGDDNDDDDADVECDDNDRILKKPSQALADFKLYRLFVNDAGRDLKFFREQFDKTTNTFRSEMLRKSAGRVGHGSGLGSVTGGGGGGGGILHGKATREQEREIALAMENAKRRAHDHMSDEVEMDAIINSAIPAAAAAVATSEAADCSTTSSSSSKKKRRAFKRGWAATELAMRYSDDPVVSHAIEASHRKSLMDSALGGGRGATSLGDAAARIHSAEFCANILQVMKEHVKVDEFSKVWEIINGGSGGGSSSKSTSSTNGGGGGGGVNKFNTRELAIDLRNMAASVVVKLGNFATSCRLKRRSAAIAANKRRKTAQRRFGGRGGEQGYDFYNLGESIVASVAGAGDYNTSSFACRLRVPAELVEITSVASSVAAAAENNSLQPSGAAAAYSPSSDSDTDSDSWDDSDSD